MIRFASLLLAGGLLAAFAVHPASVHLEELTSPELSAAVAAGTRTVLLPIGGTEQNGPHMALGKHNARARALAARIAQRLGNTIVAPVIAYVPEGAIDPPTGHMRYPGTLSIPSAALERTLEGAVRSLRRHGFTHVVLLADHGGYRASVEAVARRLPGVLAPAAYYEAATSGFARILQAQGFPQAEIGEHAGLADTALTLALVPDMVRREELARAAKAAGVSGDPRRATAELGEQGVALIVERTADAIRQGTRR